MHRFSGLTRRFSRRGIDARRSSQKRQLPSQRFEQLEQRTLLSITPLHHEGSALVAQGDVKDPLVVETYNAAATAYLPHGATRSDLASQLDASSIASAYTTSPTSTSFTQLLATGETEPNNTAATAEPLPLGFDPGEDVAVDVSGSINTPITTANLAISAAEDDGDIGSANPTGLTSGLTAVANATIGDGPFGATSGDYDFYAIDGVLAGDFITIEMNANDFGSSLNPLVGLYDSAGNLLDFNDDFVTLDSILQVVAPAGGDYYVVVQGFDSGFLIDPFDSSTGGGAGSTGFYEVRIGLNAGFVEIPSAEDDGAIGLANPTPSIDGFLSVGVGTIGDGPFGGTSGDYDMYQVFAAAGDVITVDVDASDFGTDLDSVVGIYDSSGNLLAFNDDFGDSLDSYLVFIAPATDSFFVVVCGIGSDFQFDPFDSSSGIGVGSTGDYAVRIGLNAGFNFVPSSEDDGAIPLANPTGVTSNFPVLGVGTIGDGPFGGTSGDYDMYHVAAAAGDVIVVDVDADELDTGLDSVVGIYDSAGNLLADNDDFGDWFDSYLEFSAPFADDYYVVVRGYGSGFQADPFDSSSGGGADSTGDYIVRIGLNTTDLDYFSVELDAGDILGATVLGGATTLSLRDATDFELMGSQQDASSIYPADSPLPGGGNATVSWVVDTPGTYFVRASGGSGAYDLSLGVFRPALESEEVGTHQILFLDFDGAAIDTSIFGAGGTAVLSPLASFLAGWGLSPADESAVIDAIVASVEENLSQDLRNLGNNGDFDASGTPGEFDIEILNSRDNPDPWGLANVSRVIVGGTISEFGIGTIGIAQSIDVGNFDTTESAVVLLDLLSASAGNPNSLNQFPLAGGATIFDIIGAGVGNITSHEAGHFFANWHTDQFNGFANANLMDQGGNLANTVGVGLDGIFGNGDDVDVDFGDDTFVPAEGFTGVEDTLNSIAFGLSTGTVADAPPVPIEFKRLEPLGSLMSTSLGNSETIGSSADDDGFSFYAAAGEKIGAKLAAFSPGVGVTLELRTAGGSLVASSGSTLAPTSIPANGDYVLHVKATASTLFTMDIYRNASFEQQVGDSGPGNELDIDASLVSLGSGRYGVTGNTTTGLGSTFNVYSQNFAGGLGGYVIDNTFGSGGGLWHLSTGRSADGDPNHSPPNSLYYGQNETATGGGTYDTGDDPNGGQVTSPLINLPALTALTLNFNSLIDIEDGFEELLVIVDNGIDQTVVLAPGSTGGWQTFTADLSAFAGQSIQLIFTFDTFDEIENDFEGWYIDDVSIDGAPVTADVDEYEVDLTGKAGQPIDIVMTYQTGGVQNVTLELLGTNGTTVLATALPDPLQPGTPAANYDLGILDFIVPSGGVYTLRVTSLFTGNYGIVVTDPLSFDTEPNDLDTDPLRSLDETNAALGFLGGAAGGSRIFGVDSGTSEIVEFDPATGAELNRFPLPEPIGGGAEGLAFNGASLFYGSGGAFGGGNILYELDPDTGAVIDSDAYAAIGLSDAIDGLGVFGGQVVATDTVTSEMFFVDTATDLVVGSVTQAIISRGGATGAGARGTVFTNDFFGDLIYEIDPATGSVVNSFAAPSDFVFGLAFANGSLYAGDNGTGEVFELDPDTGAVLNSFATGVPFTALGGDDPGGVSPFFNLYAIKPPTHRGNVSSGTTKAPSAALDPAPVGDQYLLTVANNDLVEISTSTPFDGAASTPWNSLNPRLVVYGPGGSIVAMDDNSAADGKNASISFTATLSGVYRIEVLAEDGTGEYVLHAEAESADSIAPTVTSVVVSSPSWSTSFRDYLQAKGLGTGGYEIPDGNGQQLQTLPWTNIKQIKIAFSEDVVVAANDLVIHGVNKANYTFLAGGFSYNAVTHIATWTLSSNVNADKLLLILESSAATGVRDAAGNALDGEWDNATSTGDSSSDTFPSGNGTAGADFRFRINVLPGDTSGNATVFIEDVFATLFRVGARTTWNNYNPRNDVDGSGLIFLDDVFAVSARLFNHLPSGTPSGLAPAAAAAERVFAELGSEPAPSAKVVAAQLADLEDTLDQLTGKKSTKSTKSSTPASIVAPLSKPVTTKK